MARGRVGQSARREKKEIGTDVQRIQWRPGGCSMKSKHIGSTMASFLEEEGIKDEVDLRTKKKVLADQILAKDD